MPSTSPTGTRKRLGAVLSAAALVGLLLGLTLGCYKPQFKEANAYCLRDSDCASGLQCVAQFCQRSVLSAAEYAAAAQEAAAPEAAAPEAAGPTPADDLVEPASPAPTPSASSEPPLIVDPALFGDYYALVIGNNTYSHIRPLRTAVRDAETVAKVLQREYAFRVTLLTNATRDEIVEALDKMRADLGEKENLLVYYAGHGVQDEASGRGYWLPVDAKRDTRARWIETTTVTDTLKAMTSKHVMVVADSCYSGTLVRDINVELRTGGDRQAYFARLLQKRSRTVLTAGGVEPVLDSGGGGHSVFAKAFLTALRDNQGIIEAQQLFLNLRRSVVLNAEQTPEYGDVRYAGHEGGTSCLYARQPRRTLNAGRTMVLGGDVHSSVENQEGVSRVLLRRKTLSQTRRRTLIRKLAPTSEEVHHFVPNPRTRPRPRFIGRDV